MSAFSVFGASGFIGSRLVAQLEAEGHAVARIGRKTWPARGSHLGHVIFTIGMTADFREKPFETVDAQVLRLRDALALIDVRVLDHFVIGDGQSVSFAERGLL